MQCCSATGASTSWVAWDALRPRRQFAGHAPSIAHALCRAPSPQPRRARRTMCAEQGQTAAARITVLRRPTGGARLKCSALPVQHRHVISRYLCHPRFQVTHIKLPVPPATAHLMETRVHRPADRVPGACQAVSSRSFPERVGARSRPERVSENTGRSEIRSSAQRGEQTKLRRCYIFHYI